MRRSEINRLIKNAKLFFKRRKFLLPPFAYFTPDDWARIISSKSLYKKYKGIIDNNLGWDLTDFGLGNFKKYGLLLFTLRNGRPNGKGKKYCEKIMIAEKGQKTPMHFHYLKTEDIINRGGGRLFIKLFASKGKKLDFQKKIKIEIDSIVHIVKPGEIVVLEPGQSITVAPRVYHEFWSDKRVLIGEVSTVNDDKTDNIFLEKVGRFPKIIEDEKPLHLLCNEYKKAKKFLK